MLDPKKMTLEDIIEWCQDNNQVEWLKKTAEEKIKKEIYPTISVNGKNVVDKTQEPTIEEKPITFIQLKAKFIDTFMPEIKPPKQPPKKKPNMWDKIKAL